jgi:acetyl esterase/lipase
VRRAVLASFTAMLTSACSPTTLLNAVAPRGGVVTASAAYAAGSRHGLDIYAPAEARDAPVVVFIYGGGWESGNRGMYRFLGATLAAAGIVCVVPDYRVWPEVRSPVFVEDAAQAVGWAQAHVAAYGGDKRRLFLMGHSAGAQMVAMLALNPAFLGAVGMQPGRDLRGVIGLSGPYDFLPLQSATLKEIFGPEAERPASQPINFVTPGAPPMLLATGADDTTVLPRNSARLAAKLRQADNQAELITYPGVGHAAIVGAFAAPLGFVAPVKRDVLRFIAERSQA